jgi:hypothetical protein
MTSSRTYDELEQSEGFDCGTFQVIESTLEFANKHPAAFAALPEAYQNDDCLIYHVYDDGEFSAQAKPDQQNSIGTGTWWWRAGACVWE